MSLQCMSFEIVVEGAQAHDDVTELTNRFREACEIHNKLIPQWYRGCNISINYSQENEENDWCTKLSSLFQDMITVYEKIIILLLHYSSSKIKKRNK